MGKLLTPVEVQEFRQLIAGYQPNNEVLEQFRTSNFVVIAGPAGAGKDSLRDSLILRYPEIYVPILSTTTRPARQGETEGRTYHFWEVEGVKLGLERREFFQAALVHDQQISCLHVSEIKRLNAAQYGLSILIPVTETELRLIKNNLKTLFLIPPNVTDLRQRIRSERMLDNDEIDRRLEAARKEIEYALKSEYYHCLVTETIESATDKAHRFIQTGDLGGDDDARARVVMREILRSLNEKS